MRLQSTLWIGGDGAVHPPVRPLRRSVDPKILIVLGFSGAVVVGISSLFVEFSMRPVEAELIAAGTPAGAVDDCAAARSRHAAVWSGIPIVGILLVALFACCSPT